MRELLYYPMIHIPSEDYLRDSITNLLLEKKIKELKIPNLFTDKIVLKDDTIEEVLSGLTLVGQEISELYKLINSDWNEFTDFIKTKPPFNRVYLEGIFSKGEIPKFLFEKDEGMGGCIKYLINQGAIFEKTENINFYNDENHKAREEFVCKKIKKTLKDSERGLLLYGAAHALNLSKMLSSYKSINSEIYSQKD